MIRVLRKQTRSFQNVVIVLVTSAVAILPAAGSGCAQKYPIEEGRLVIALPGTPVSLDPRVATDAYGAHILQMTHASLVRLDAAGNPVPDLAERWETPDPLTRVFRLRQALRFHDGRPLTSADVRFTFEWILDPANRPPHRRLPPRGAVRTLPSHGRARHRPGRKPGRRLRASRRRGAVPDRLRLPR